MLPSFARLRELGAPQQPATVCVDGSEAADIGTAERAVAGDHATPVDDGREDGRPLLVLDGGDPARHAGARVDRVDLAAWRAGVEGVSGRLAQEQPWPVAGWGRVGPPPLASAAVERDHVPVGADHVGPGDGQGCARGGCAEDRIDAGDAGAGAPADGPGAGVDGHHLAVAAEEIGGVAVVHRSAACGSGDTPHRRRARIERLTGQRSDRRAGEQRGERRRRPSKRRAHPSPPGTRRRRACARRRLWDHEPLPLHQMPTPAASCTIT